MPHKRTEPIQCIDKVKDRYVSDSTIRIEVIDKGSDMNALAFELKRQLASMPTSAVNYYASAGLICGSWHIRVQLERRPSDLCLLG